MQTTKSCHLLFLLFGLFLSGSVLSGCSRNQQIRQIDSWDNPSPPGQGPITSDARRLDEKDFQKVRPDKQKQSEVLLKSSSATKLSSQIAVDFTGIQLKLKGGKTPYLIRGIGRADDIGSFAIYEKGSSLWVMNGNLGSGPVKTKRVSLVVFLAKAPTKVFVSYSVAQ